MFNVTYRVRGHRSHKLVLHLFFFSSVNWQGHEVWTHALLLLLSGRQGRGEGLRGVASTSASPTPGLGGMIYTRSQGGLLFRWS